MAKMMEGIVVDREDLAVAKESSYSAHGCSFPLVGDDFNKIRAISKRKTAKVILRFVDGFSASPYNKTAFLRK